MVSNNGVYTRDSLDLSIKDSYCWRCSVLDVVLIERLGIFQKLSFYKPRCKIYGPASLNGSSILGLWVILSQSIMYLIIEFMTIVGRGMRKKYFNALADRKKFRFCIAAEKKLCRHRLEIFFYGKMYFCSAWMEK